ncbi:MAG: TetR/AcrR family transcriptional regulator [Methanobacterium sp.]
MSTQDIREQKKEQRRKYILNVAEKLFFMKGYNDVSMNDIAREAGLNKSVIYRYFKNKESLYFAIVLRGTKIFNKMFKEKVKLKETGIEKLEEAGRAYFDFYRKYPDYHDAYLYFRSKRFELNDIEYSLEIDLLTNDILKIIRDVIQEGIDDRTIRKSLKPMEVAVFIALTAERIVRLSPNTLNVLKSQGISHEQFIEDSMDLWKHMVMNYIEN